MVTSSGALALEQRAPVRGCLLVPSPPREAEIHCTQVTATSLQHHIPDVPEAFPLRPTPPQHAAPSSSNRLESTVFSSSQRDHYTLL